MKKILLTLTLLLCTVKLNAQVSIDWQKCLGGTNIDRFSSILPTSDGGYILSGDATSNDGDISGKHGLRDAWIVKLNAIGAIQWQKCLGGSGEDYIYSIILTSDGGYLLSGSTSSNDGDVSGNHGKDDAWVVKLNSIGIIQWQKCFGGSSWDVLRSILPTSDGGYILSGSTSSNDGDISGNHGGRDIWIVKLNSTGIVLWQKYLGGTKDDDLNSILATSDGGYILSGDTFSNDGDVFGNHGKGDAWIVKLNATGAIQWQKCFGGTQNESSNSLLQTADGGYIVSAHTNSNDGDVSGNNGLADAWIVKLNATGTLLWQKCLTGAVELEPNSVSSIEQTSDGGYILSVSTLINTGNVSGNHGGQDCWIVKLSA